jgi:hypothetical protein
MKYCMERALSVSGRLLNIEDKARARDFRSGVWAPLEVNEEFLLRSVNPLTLNIETSLC